MQVLNLKRDFESLTIIALIVNKIRSLSEEFPDARIVEKQVQVADADSQEEKLFVASCFSSEDSYNAWFIDSGCTHHICHNVTIFKDLDKTYNSTVKVGNGGYVDVKERGTLISYLLFIPDISQNLLSVGQMLENQYSLQFKDNQCIIFDPYGDFAINWENATQYAYVGITQSV
ncbi:hypothetical protein AAG906_025679 [Vitis piasezkii]